MSLTLSDNCIDEIRQLIKDKMAFRIIALKFDVDIEFIRGISASMRKT